MSFGFALRSCALTSEKDEHKRLPVGVDHANDGIATPDGFQWGHKITHWFAVELIDGIGAIQVMSWSRLAKALKFVDRPFPARRDGYGEDDINYTGPLEPPIERRYELTWPDKRAIYPPNSSFAGIPKLEHRIRLPEVLDVINKPIMDDSSSEWEQDPTRCVEYHRVYPPPRYLFDDERLRATLTFSSNSSEFVGRGHWSKVFRTKMEHPDFTTQLKKKSSAEGDNEQPEAMQVDSTVAEDEPDLPFQRYSHKFYLALLQYYISQLRGEPRFDPTEILHLTEIGGPGKLFPMNLDPSLSDSAYESELAEKGEFGVPWWTIQEAYIKMRFKDAKVKTLNEVGVEKSEAMMKDIVKEIENEITEDGGVVEGGLKTKEEEEITDEEDKPTGDGMEIDEGQADPESKTQGKRKRNGNGNGNEKKKGKSKEKETDEAQGEIAQEKPSEDKGKGKEQADSGSGGGAVEDEKSAEKDGAENERIPKVDITSKDVEAAFLTFDPVKKQFMAMSRAEAFHNTVENEPDTLSERIHRAQQVMFFSKIDETHNNVIEKMLESPKKVVLDHGNRVIIDPSKVVPPSTKSSSTVKLSKDASDSKEENKEASPAPNPTESEWETRQLPFTMLAKLPFSGDEAHSMLRKEGYNYSLFPEHLMEAREGYIQTKPMQMPLPAAAVVPRFYGLYRACRRKAPPQLVTKKREGSVKAEKGGEGKGEDEGKEDVEMKGSEKPEGAGAGGEGEEEEEEEGKDAAMQDNEKIEGNCSGEDHSQNEGDADEEGGDEERGDEEADDYELPKGYSNRYEGFVPGEWVMLMEECGTQVSETSLSTSFKNQIMSMSVRLHRFGMLQCSPYVRNVVVQPGPLTLPPSSRTFRCPSFRIIDFGRGEHYNEDERGTDFVQEVDDEERRLANELMFSGWMAAGRIWPGNGYVTRKQRREERV